MNRHLNDQISPTQGDRVRRRITIPLTDPDDFVLIHPNADAAIRAHLTEHPEDIDRYTGRRHRVALVSDAGALPAGADPGVALVGMESTAAFLQHHSGLDVTPLPIDTRRTTLEEAVAALTPGFTAICLHRTSPACADSVRRRLARRHPALPILDTADDATAVTVLAALLNAVRQADLPLIAGRVLIVDGHTAPAIGALLAAAGARDLTFAASDPAADLTPGDMPGGYDVLIDLSAVDSGPPSWLRDLARPRVVLSLSSTDFESAPAGSAGNDPTPTGAPGSEVAPSALMATGRLGGQQLHPLLALPGLLSVAVHRRITIDAANRLAAAEALAGLAPPGRLLPDALDPRITATVYAAVTRPPH